MDLEQITPDTTVYWEYGFVKLNATIVFTWVLMAVLVVGSWLITRRLSSGEKISRWQNMLELIVIYSRDQIRQVAHQRAGQYLPFIGTLFLFIAMGNALTIIPAYVPPFASLSTTAALALCVFLAVPFYGIWNEGVGSYLRHYIEPTVLMLPFQIIGELSRTLALAVRLFGNVMSGAKIIGILLAIAPFFLPVLMTALGLLTGLIQAYIFAILAMVYIASGMRSHEVDEEKAQDARES